MKAIVLYGAKCNLDIWNYIRVYLKDYDIEYLAFPHEILKNATSIDDIVDWTATYYNKCNYDVIVGHSMGGQVALKMLPLLKNQPTRVILIDSNPVPSGQLYRNLMTEANMNTYGKTILEMFKREEQFYSKELLLSLMDDYNLLSYIREYKGNIYAIYGDRGQLVGKNHYHELFLPEDVINRINIYFIHNACHLPMIENPSELSNILTQLLQCEV